MRPIFYIKDQAIFKSRFTIPCYRCERTSTPPYHT